MPDLDHPLQHSFCISQLLSFKTLTHVLKSLLRCLCPFEQEQAHGLLVKAAGGPQALANCVGSFLVWEDPKKKGAKTLSLVNTHGLIEDNAITRDSDGACFHDFFLFASCHDLTALKSIARRANHVVLLLAAYMRNVGGGGGVLRRLGYLSQADA